LPKKEPKAKKAVVHEDEHEHNAEAAKGHAKKKAAPKKSAAKKKAPKKKK